MGNIVGTGPEDIRGEVLACQAESKEEIESHLRSHPLAKVSEENLAHDSHYAYWHVVECLGHGIGLNLAFRHCA